MLTDDQIDAMIEELEDLQQAHGPEALSFCHACAIGYTIASASNAEALRDILNILAKALRITNDQYRECSLMARRHALTVLQSRRHTDQH